MLKAARVSIFAGLACLSALGAAGRGQEPGGFGGVQSFGFSSSYSPTSSHILIGDAEHRRVWTLGAEYTHLLRLRPRFRLDYEGSVMPLYEETDPTVTGTVFISGRSADRYAANAGARDLRDQRTDRHRGYGKRTLPPRSTLCTDGRTPTPPRLLRWAPGSARSRAGAFSRASPSISASSSPARDIPVDDSDQFNYLFSFGPGVAVLHQHARPRGAWSTSIATCRMRARELRTPASTRASSA